MPVKPADYFRYFSVAPGIRQWGLGLTAAGHTVVKPGSPYPPVRHPDDHQFDWEHGRVLHAMQIVLITDGQGWFESRGTGRRRIEAGTAFALLPKVWHRYRPDLASGWVESWIEIQGPVVENLLRSGVLSPSSAMLRVPGAAGLEAALAAVHLRARSAAAGFDPELAAAALGVLASWERARLVRPERSRIVRVVSEAERYLAEHLAEPVNIEDLARRLGMAYSHFRRVFRVQTGFAPWQYVLNLRLSQARRVLASSDITLDDLAGRLGFSSAFHLSTAFKQATGVAPDRWRRRYRLRERSG